MFGYGTIPHPIWRSGLEARSYQPALNSQKNPATLMSLERRANSGSGSSPSFVKVPKRPFSDIFTDDMISSEKYSLYDRRD
ncbi:hypothetical protein BASA84_000609 [Batrachochytrium salamandrivorans]|nr:hypothetical protein BASA84_000609 [Batrachochytrium salamandrivorans]